MQQVNCKLYKYPKKNCLWQFWGAATNQRLMFSGCVFICFLSTQTHAEVLAFTHAYIDQSTIGYWKLSISHAVLFWIRFCLKLSVFLKRNKPIKHLDVRQSIYKLESPQKLKSECISFLLYLLTNCHKFRVKTTQTYFLMFL